ncbi:ABC transporter permease subunit [Oceanimonas sp. CHS3-5]|uniref:ABC transporter permease n=1 Tax=Oceanimonas sp. CHS3-5 TaxID=3068186 RepID=UPI0027402949|nr:ABC transporter permease subunit [Oceanimonas sp. CHS3-5]MDP5293637.1 ABC transporter permease subunit [Oceanimonas sp. CHS3-5]
MPDLRTLKPHRLLMAGVALAAFTAAALNMDWSWLPKYQEQIVSALGVTVALFVTSVLAGGLLAVPLGLAQVAGPWPLAWLARGFCTVIRGTPILLQMWLLYYGLGSLFPYMPELRQSWLWPYLIEAWPYAFVALTLSFAGYEGEVMRGAFKGVPRGELEAAYSMGMRPFTILRRIWLPRAVQRVLPTLGGELILHLKATPLVATIAVIDIYAIIARIRQETFITYEPLLLLAFIYTLLAAGIALGVWLLEKRLPASK